MKTMTGLALALATLLASPAYAQSNQGNWWDAYHSYAQQYQEGPQRFSPEIRRQSLHQSWDVYNTNGRYVGSDPDPNVRDMLARDRVEGGW